MSRVFLSKGWFAAYRLLLRIITLARFPKLTRDPSALVFELWKGFQKPLTEKTCSAEGESQRPSLLIIIPFRNKWHLTAKALNSIYRQNVDNVKISIALVDNNSSKDLIPKVESWIATKRSETSEIDCRLIHLPIEFNYSRLNNVAFESFGGRDNFSHILFQNNDVELLSNSTLQRMINFLERRAGEVGALGATLLYPQGRVQHSFVAPGVVLVGAHPLKGVPYNQSLRWFQEPRRVPAVTGALMMMQTSAFETVERFDENLPTAYQDVDLCLKLHRAGYSNYTLAPITAIHHESATRKILPEQKEAEYMYRKWGDELTWHPLVPRKLSRWSENPSLRLFESDFPWRKLFDRKSSRETARADSR